MLRSQHAALGRTAPVVAAFVAVAGTAQAQQFTYSQGLLSGSDWSEGVEPSDVDNDGDLDLFFADGNGFSSAGTKKQNRLHINQLVEQGPNVWTDESIARLGARVSNAKMVVAADVTGDGFEDALFCNGFNTDTPFLYINRGNQAPGVFLERAAQRGLGQIYSSASGQFGDLDNDGDLDLILCDSGSSFLGGSGDRPKLFFNDGAGFFTEDAAKLNAPIMRAHMDVQLVDIDNDFDLDFFGPNRANNDPGGDHYLMLNDGTGTFTDASPLIPSTSSSVYEAEVGDLDGDDDLDFFFVSLSGFSEGPMRNTLDSGSLGFTAGSTLSGSDDNEVALLDFDMDGDYDVAIGSLGNTEKLFRNDGNANFSTVANDFTSVNDSTLDIACADLDNDGDYDFVTAQGESGQSQWVNKIYLNSGPVDTRAPIIVRIEDLTLPPANGPWVVRAQFRDQVMDDGHDWLSARVQYRVETPTGFGPITFGEAMRMAGGLWRFEMADTAEGLGTKLQYAITVTDWAGNSTSSGFVDVPLGPKCGVIRYGLAAGGANVLGADAIGGTDLGEIFQVVVDAPTQPAVAVVLAFGRDAFPIAGGTGLLDLATYYTYVVAPVTGGTATTTWGLPLSATSLIGNTLNFQAVVPDPGVVGGLALSNGVEIAVCQ